MSTVMRKVVENQKNGESLPDTRISHLGIIMDGNGRWAKARGQSRTTGHREGLVTAKKIVAALVNSGISHVSLYTFSTENWKRTEEEVSYLMGLIRSSLKKEYAFYRENGIRVVHSGDLHYLPKDIQQEISDVEADTAGFGRLTVNLAINYGGRNEIVRAMKAACADGVQPSDLTEENLAGYFDQPELPDLDLVIRTGGEKRLSNFMLWQSSYSELYFSETLWPDFSTEELENIIDWYEGRNRRFGGM